MLSRNQTKPEVYIGPREYLSRDISVYFREFKGQDVNAPRKIISILFQLKTSKNYLSRGGGMRLQVPLFSSQCVPLIFRKCPFVSWNCPFVFQKCLSISQKYPIVTQNCPGVTSFYLLCASFSKNDFFPADCNFLPCSELLTEIIFTLLLFWFLLDSLLTNSWCLLDNLKTSTWNVIFYVFKF